jgi:hypothetical protein
VKIGKAVKIILLPILIHSNVIMDKLLLLHKELKLNKIYHFFKKLYMKIFNKENYNLKKNKHSKNKENKHKNI